MPESFRRRTSRTFRRSPTCYPSARGSSVPTSATSQRVRSRWTCMMLLRCCFRSSWRTSPAIPLKCTCSVRSRPSLGCYTRISPTRCSTTMTFVSSACRTVTSRSFWSKRLWPRRKLRRNVRNLNRNVIFATRMWTSPSWASKRRSRWWPFRRLKRFKRYSLTRWWTCSWNLLRCCSRSSRNSHWLPSWRL